MRLGVGGDESEGRVMSMRGRVMRCEGEVVRCAGRVVSAGINVRPTAIFS